MSLHIARSWGATEIEQTCPCPKESCGFVDLDRTDPACTEHPQGRGRTIRGHHTAEQCPGPRTTTKEKTVTDTDSTYASMEGEITIDPPLTWGQIRTGPRLRALAYVKEEATVDTDEGQLTKVTAYALAPASTRAMSVRRFAEELRTLAAAFPDHALGGHLTGSGRDAEDLFRLIVRDGEPARITPTITWPDA